MKQKLLCSHSSAGSVQEWILWINSTILQSFQNFLEKEQYVLVEFAVSWEDEKWAYRFPKMEASKTLSKVVIVKVDNDYNSEIENFCEVTSTTTRVLFVKTDRVFKQIGFDIQELEETVRKYCK